MGDGRDLVQAPLEYSGLRSTYALGNSGVRIEILLFCV